MHSLPSCDVFHNLESNCYFLFFCAWTVRRLCVTETNLGQRKHNEFRACALLVSIALDWRWSDALLVSKFTRGKTFIFSNMQKMSLTHTVNEKRLSDVLVKSPTNCDARPANHNALTKILHFLVCWTCVMVCVTGSLDNSIRQSACQVHLYHQVYQL